MRFIKSYKIFESLIDHLGLLQDLSVDLSDEGLYVDVTTDDVRFQSRVGVDYIYLKISDDDNKFCDSEKEEWLLNTDIIKNFITRLEDIGIKRDKDYKMYGGGPSVTLVFEGKQINSIKLESMIYGTKGIDNLDIVSDVSDILLEIEDEGINCRMWVNKYRDSLHSYNMKKQSRLESLKTLEIEINHEGFDLSIVENTVIRLKKYFESIEWNLVDQRKNLSYYYLIFEKKDDEIPKKV